MRKVAQRAGLSATAIYRHFDDKKDLLHEVTLGGFRLLASYLERAERVPDPMQRLLTSARCYVDFALENPEYYQTMFMATDLLTGVRRFDDGAPPDEIRATFFTHLEFTRACEFETDDLMGLAVSGWGLCHGLVSLHLANRLAMLGDREFRDYYDTTIDRFYLAFPRRRP